jgi:hypothetical protein
MGRCINKTLDKVRYTYFYYWREKREKITRSEY